MGRVRGKGKKQAVTAFEDPGSGGDEKNPTSNRRRGRPQKAVKEEAHRGEETEKIEEVVELAQSLNSQEASESGKKRKRSAPVTESSTEAVKEESTTEAKSTPDATPKFVSFRHIGSRRKNKPHRAAEVGVECN